MTVLDLSFPTCWRTYEAGPSWGMDCLKSALASVGDARALLCCYGYDSYPSHLQDNQSGNMDQQDSCPIPVAQHVDLLSARKMIHSIESCASQRGLKRNDGNNYNHSSGPSPDMVLSTFPIFAHLIPTTTLRSRYYIILVLDLRGLRPREGKQCAQGHTVSGGAEIWTHTIWFRRTLQTVALPCLLSHNVK